VARGIKKIKFRDITMEKQKSIGAFWVKTSNKGNKFYSGNIEIDGKKIMLVAFDNKKEKENQPDIRIYESQPMEKKGNLPF
jgi:uncharacterized protein (DUF736 family)